MSNWIYPALVTGGGMVGAGGVGLAIKWFGRMFRRVIAEIVASCLEAFKADLDRRFDVNDEQTKQAADKASSLELELARQFGGNGGGIREAINSLTRDVAFLKGASGSSSPGGS